MTIKIYDRYFNYDNVDQIDFEIRENKDTKDKIYIINVLTHGVNTRIITNGKEDWGKAKERFESGLIWGFMFRDLIPEDES